MLATPQNINTYPLNKPGYYHYMSNINSDMKAIRPKHMTNINCAGFVSCLFVKVNISMKFII